ncbi:phosphatidylserine decarboxylase 1 [Phlyctochytrium planicorne]|nr:phosphatidylserine decarboxylase 1 [Phlyctochytrium planicorne]
MQKGIFTYGSRGLLGRTHLHHHRHLPLHGAFKRQPLAHARCYHQQQQQERRSFYDEVIESFKRAREAFFGTNTIWQPIPISLGIAVIAILHLRRVKERNEEENSKRPPVLDEDLIIEGPWQLNFKIRMYAALPLREASRLWGWLNGLTVPAFLRSPFYKLYSSAFGCNLDEMANPDLTSYPNLGEFFYRELKDGARPIDKSSDLVSPSDGRVLTFGVIQDRRVEQVKGVTYSLDTLLGKEALQYHPAKSTPAITAATSPNSDPSAKSAPSKGNALHYCVIYLAPGDYHRFHSPVDWTVYTLRHFAGELLSVSPMIVEKIRNLFVLNERVTMTGSWKHGFFAMIPVGATNVGSICIDLDPELKTNQPTDANPQPLGTFTEKTLGSKGRTIYRGQELGGFRLGSTVVLVFEAPSDRFAFKLQAGQKVRMGESIGTFR